MRIITENMQTNGAVLTGYIHDTSVEMPHLNIRPAVLIFPGGAYRYCSEKEAEPVALAYLQQGFNAFVLRYTVGEPMEEVYNQALIDAEEALVFLRTNAVQLHVDAKQIAAVGFSAGGSLAAGLGILSKEKPNALVLGYSAFDSDLNEVFGIKAPFILDQVTETVPPSFVFAAQGDTVISSRNTLLFSQALAEKKVPYEVHVFANGDHGFSLGNELVCGPNEARNMETAKWLDLSVKFLNRIRSGQLLDSVKDEREYGIGMRLDQIMANVRSAAIFEKHLPGIRKMVGGEPMAAAISIQKLAGYTKGMIPGEKLIALDTELKTLNMKNKKEVLIHTAIHPGKVWLDTNGERIQAHAGAIFYEDNTYYWYGENKEKTDGKNGIWTWGIRAYSSKDLYNWQDEGLIIPPDTNDPKSSMHPSKHIDRPHILKSESTGKYICWIKLSGEEACFTILSADSMLGPYKMEKNEYYPLGQKVGDFDMIQDEENDKAYLIMDSDHACTVCMELTEDYLDVVREVSRQYEGLHAPFCREGVAVFAREGKKYMLTSGMTGYIPNQSDSAVSDSFTQPFTSIGDPHVNDDSKASFNSQISKVFKVPGKKDLYIALADRWVPEYMVDAKRADLIMRGIAGHYEPEKYQLNDAQKAELMNSPMLGTANTSIADYVWLPLRFTADKVWIDWYDEWKVEDYD